MNLNRIAVLVLMTLVIAQLSPTLARDSDISLEVEAKDPCIAGFKCRVNITIRNYDSLILVHSVRITSPWGVFTEKIGWKEMKENSKLVVTMTVKIDRNALEGPAPLIPSIKYYKRGKLGLNTLEGNRSFIMVIKPKINATLFVLPNKEEAYVGETLEIEGSYKVEGVPEGFNPSLLLYIDEQLQIERQLNGTIGSFSLSMPMKKEGNHSFVVSLCYEVGCVDKKFNVIVRRPIKIVSGYGKDEIIKMLNEVRGIRAELQDIYESAVNNSVALREDTLLKIALIDSKIREVSKLLNKSELSYSDVVRGIETLNQSKKMINEVIDSIVESYREMMRRRYSRVIEEFDRVRNIVNQTDLRSTERRLEKVSGLINNSTRENITQIYLNVTSELDSIEYYINSIRKKTLEEAKLLSAITASLMFIAMISGVTVILRKWKSLLRKAE